VTTKNGLTCGDRGVTSLINGLLLQAVRGRQLYALSTASFHPTQAGQAFLAQQIQPRLISPLTYSGGTWTLSGTVGQSLSADRYLTGGVLPLTVSGSLDGAAPPDWLTLSGSDRKVT